MHDISSSELPAADGGVGPGARSYVSTNTNRDRQYAVISPDLAKQNCLTTGTKI